MHNVKRKFINWKRDRYRDAVVRDGERLREVRAARAGIDSSIWPHDARMMDEEIEVRERAQQRRLDYLKKTAQEA